MSKDNRENSSTLFKEKPIILFIFFSVLPLLLPAFINSLDLFRFSIVFLVISLFLYREVLKAKEIRVFFYLLFLYVSWIVLSSIVHYGVLSTLNPTTFITVYRHNAAWGIVNLKNTAYIYLLFPALFMLAILLLKFTINKYRMLYVLTLFAIPSLIVAFYQGIFDVSFLNHPHFIPLNRVAGLASDPNAFGLSMFLLFPLCVSAIIMVQDNWKRLLLILLGFFIIWGLLLSGTLTGFAGLIISLLLFPWIVVWAVRTLSRVKRRLLLLSPFILFTPFILTFLLVNLATISFKKDLPFPSVLIMKLNTSYEDYRNDGIKFVAQKSGRLNLGYNAYRLTRLSPLSGWGPGGFTRNLQNVRVKSGEVGYFFLMDNANNQYLQMSSELGLLGLSFNVFLHLLPLWMVFRIRNNIHDRNERIAVGCVSLTVLIMMLLFITGPHTMAVSVLWIFVVMLAYLVVTAHEYGYSFRGGGIKLVSGFLAIFTLLFFIGTVNNVLGRQGYRSTQSADWWPLKYEKNCYQSEYIDNWKELRWCKEDSSLQIPFGRITKSDRIRLNLVLYHPDINKNPVTLKYGGKTGPTNEMIISDNNMKTIEIPFTDDNIFEFRRPEGRTVKYFVLSLDVSRTWIPKEWNASDDTRELGVAVIHQIKKR